MKFFCFNNFFAQNNIMEYPEVISKPSKKEQQVAIESYSALAEILD